MSHAYRCGACRTRNVFKRPVVSLTYTNQYDKKICAPKTEKELKQRLKQIGGAQCKHCRATRFYPDRERRRRVPCACGGYQFVHRRGSRYCDLNPLAAYWWAVRCGADATNLAMEAALGNLPTHRVSDLGRCPF